LSTASGFDVKNCIILTVYNINYVQIKSDNLGYSHQSRIITTQPLK